MSEIKKIEEIFKKIKNSISFKDTLKAIKITNTQTSAIIDSSDTIAMDDLRALDDIIKGEFLHFVEDKFILSCYDCDEREIYINNEDLLYLRKICNQLGEYICSCTGNEMFITDSQIMCFLDIPEMSYEQYDGIGSIFGTNGYIVFDDRPYISFKFRGDSNE